jgi:hypothetical protein
MNETQRHVEALMMTPLVSSKRSCEMNLIISRKVTNGNQRGTHVM